MDRQRKVDRLQKNRNYYRIIQETERKKEHVHVESENKKDWRKRTEIVRQETDRQRECKQFSVPKQVTPSLKAISTLWLS